MKWRPGFLTFLVIFFGGSLSLLYACSDTPKGSQMLGDCEHIGIMTVPIPDAGTTCYLYCGIRNSSISCVRDRP